MGVLGRAVRVCMSGSLGECRTLEAEPLLDCPDDSCVWLYRPVVEAGPIVPGIVRAPAVGQLAFRLTPNQPSSLGSRLCASYKPIINMNQSCSYS